MAIPIVVPDASVILKWMLRGPDEGVLESALALRDAWLEGAIDIVVPTLWIYEVGNVLGMKQAREAQGLPQAVIDLAMPEESAAAYSTDILEVMHTHGVTFYDAAYHALAIVQRGTMVTADRRYVKKSEAKGHVQLIDSWVPPAGSKRPRRA